MMIRRLGEQGKWNKIKKNFESMKYRGLQRSGIIHAALVDICGQYGKFQDAEECLAALRSEGVQPSASMFCALANANAQQDELLRGLEATLGSSFSTEPLVPPSNPLVIVISGPSGVGKDAVIKGFINIYHIEPESILRILDICQELKILTSVLEIAPFKFSIKLAAYASRKEHINLEKWSSENMDAYKDAFFERYCFES